MSHDLATRLTAALEGRYRIKRQLGEGGMATVYLAEDLRHERKVALKVLKPELAAVVGAERFLAEIKTTANLQHPHVLPLHDSGNADGFLYYVMPYVEGETLRDRMDREKQLPVQEAVDIAVAVAHALDYAHRRGVIHRDIKPANILFQDGQPVVADFGIAIAVGAAGGSRLTETGLSVGTPFYMSPEQATGDQMVGPASDIYALSCVLYEMLTGEPPYLGNTAQAVLGKIIQGLPVSATATRKSVPPNVDAAIRKALEKLPADRFTGAHEFAAALTDAGFRHGPEAVAAGGVPDTRWKRVAIGALATAGALAVLSAWLLTRGGAGAAGPPLHRRFEIGVGRLTALPVTNARAELAISRDGTKVAYSAVVDALPALHVRSLDQTETRVLAGTGVAYTPFFSPDGEWVGYLDPQAGQLKKISVQGGQPITLAPAPGAGRGGTWLEDGSIVFASNTNPVLFQVPEAGGTPVQLTTRSGAGEAHFYPEALPGGRQILFTLFPLNDMESGRIELLSLETGEVRTIVDVGHTGHYLPSGHLVFARQGSLWAIRFDPESGETSGQAVVVLQGVEMTNNDHPTAAFSPQGLMVYLPGDASGAQSGATIPMSLVWVDERGVEEPLPLPARQYAGPRLSPDGTRLAVSVFDGNAFALWVYDVASGAALRLTQDGGSRDMLPIWTPDGSRIVYRATDDPNSALGDLYWIPADGSGRPERITSLENAGDYPTSISPDGETVIFTRILDPGPNLHREIMAVSLDGNGEARPVLEGDFAFGNASLSPDGRWIAYRSDESGQYEIYLQPYPGPGAKTPVSIGGGSGAVWSTDGSTIFYRAAGQFMAADVQLGASARVGRPRELFPDDAYFVVPGGGGRQYHVAPDGRLLLIRALAASSTAANDAHLVVVENWLDELEQLVPAGR